MSPDTTPLCTAGTAEVTIDSKRTPWRSLMTLGVFSSIICWVWTGCSDEQSLHDMRHWLWFRKKAAVHVIQNPAAVRKVADANIKFTKDIYMSVRDQSPKNMVVSPCSLSALMGLSVLGADKGTGQEIMTTLSFPSDGSLHPGMQDVLASLTSNINYTLAIANRLYLQDGYKVQGSFTTTAQKYYPEGLEMVDFTKPEKARHTINGWVQGRTKNKLHEALPPDALDPQTRMFLVNAIYFKGSWLQRFETSQTHSERFYFREGLEGKVHMMHLAGSFRISSVQRLDATILELPYKGDRLSFIIILPNERYGMRSVEDKLPSYDLNQVNTRLMMAPKRRTELHLPRFAIDTTHDLVGPLQELGIIAAFSHELADFSTLSPVENLHISGITQRAVFQINEHGQEGEDIEEAEVKSNSAGRGPSPPFVCDHPFLFVVKDKLTRMILFAGRVMEPELAS